MKIKYFKHNPDIMHSTGIVFQKHNRWHSPRGWGGGTHIFSANVGSGPASTVLPQKNLEFQATHKKNEILATTKKYPLLYTLTLRKDPKMHRKHRYI